MESIGVKQFRRIVTTRKANSLLLAFTLTIAFVGGLFVTPAAHAQTFSVIHTFAGTDGNSPYAGVSIRGGNLFGTTAFGGGNNGVVYEISRSGSNWLEYPISYLGGGYHPTSRALFGPDGHLFSTTVLGGNSGDGLVFNLTPPASVCKTAQCFWRENDLYSFEGGPLDGENPASGDLIWDQQGNIFGTTKSGGQTNSGTVYELMPSGNGYTEKVLYGFPAIVDGAGPNGVVMDSNGNLFGAAESGGLQDCPEQQDCGVIFELTNVPGVGWQEKVLYAFTGGSDGGTPYGGVIVDAAGNLYGTTPKLGDGGAGTIFELSPSGDTWTYKVLYSFSGVQGCGSWASLTMDVAGNLYGTTDCTGAYQRGSVFKLANTQNGWQYTSLYDFTGGADGGFTTSNVTIDTDGSLYGTSTNGGSFQGTCAGQGCGTVWMVKP